MIDRIPVEQAKEQLKMAKEFVTNLPVMVGAAAKGGAIHDEVDAVKVSVIALLAKLETLDDPQTAVEPLIELFNHLQIMDFPLGTSQEVKEADGT